ncbi:MAG: Zn-dependent exopeptidase M28 [Erysipelotrichales bacterium]|nr:Zn-dependent exopeptidase M28 [Erysipelotrichales bacterium]
MINVDKEYRLLEDLYFERIGGTDKEREAASIIQSYLEEVGLTSRIEEFEVNCADIKKASLEVLEPYQKSYPVEGYKNSGNVDGLESDLYYLECVTPVSKIDAKDKIVLVNGYVGMKNYKAIKESGAKGFISFNGHVDYHDDEVDLDKKELRQMMIDLGPVPGVNLKVKDAIELVDRQASKVRMTLQQEEGKNVSWNVICDIEGSEYPNEVIVFTAHYDSVPFSKGAYDNGTGSVALYSLATYFKEHQPKRSVRFVWCGSEERGLLGSKAYCEAHKEELEKVLYCINIDMIGSILGHRIAVATANEDVVHYTQYYADIHGFPLEASQGVYSSDSTPFADCGVPSISFARITPRGGGDIHNRFDVIEHLSKRILGEDTGFIVKYAESLINAYAFPIKKEMPQKMKDEIDKYYMREKKEK